MEASMMSYTFNRTIIELKLRKNKMSLGRELAFNRTIIELKLSTEATCNKRLKAFNRTIIELKHDKKNRRAGNTINLLIGLS